LFLKIENLKEGDLEGCMFWEYTPKYSNTSKACFKADDPEHVYFFITESDQVFFVKHPLKESDEGIEWEELVDEEKNKENILWKFNFDKITNELKYDLDSEIQN